MSAISIRAPKRKPIATRPPPSKVPVKPVVKPEPIELPVDDKKWTSYTIRAGNDMNDNGTRYNIMRFQTSKNINPATDLRGPIKLARRDMNEFNAEPLVDGDAAGENGETGSAGGTASGTTIAPTVAPVVKPVFSVAPHGGQPLQRKHFKKRTHEVYQQDEEVRKLRQEERFPWLLEDDSGKDVYQGSLEGGQGNTYVFMRLSANGFEVTPVSKFYKFSQRQRFQTMSLDEAEEKMKKHKSLPRWVMKEGDEASRSGSPMREPQKQYQMKTTSARQRVNVKAEEQEEELDFNEDFADDEEQHGLVDDEEDNKALEERIKKEQLSANALGEADAEAEQEADEVSKRKLDREGRRVQRFLEKLEKNNMYASDSDSNPYESSSEDSEDEKDAKTSATASVKGEDEDKKKSTEKTRDEKIRESVNNLQNISHTTYNTGSPSTVISRTNSSTNLANMKAHARARKTRPHLVTLKLPTSLLARFSNIPQSSAQDKKKRSAVGGDGYDSDRSQKKLRFQDVGSGANSAAVSRAASPIARSTNTSSPASRTGTPDPDRDLITADELRSIVMNADPAEGLTMRGLLKMLRPKLARDPRNKPILAEVMKAGGLVVIDGKVTLR